MHLGAFDHGQIIEAFTRCVPGTYVRDYRDKDGYITICRGYKTLHWKDQTTTQNRYEGVPKETLFSMPRGSVQRKSLFSGPRLVRPGWQSEFRRAASQLSSDQRRKIEKFLRAKVFPEAA